MTPPQRTLQHPTGTLNFRDVGGLPAGPGRRVRHGVLFRSDTLQFLTEDDVDLLVGGLGLRTEVDLRRLEEADREGRGPIARTDVVHGRFPVFSRHEDATVGADVPAATHAEPVAEHYLGYLTGSAEAISGAVRALAAPGALPALVHCAAGKDRTGVVVAFALSVAGVSDDDVAAEYARDPDRVAATVERLRGCPGYATLIDRLPADAHVTPAEYMARFLAQVRVRHGGPRAWLATVGGVPGADLDRLAEALTEPA